MRKPRRTRAKPENKLQYTCVETLRWRALPGVWWHHSPNEQIRTEAEIFHQRNMGCLFGIFDLEIFKIDRVHLIEIKPGMAGQLTENEEKFRGKMFELGVPHAVCRDIDAFTAQCLKWELIK